MGKGQGDKLEQWFKEVGDDAKKKLEELTSREKDPDHLYDSGPLTDHERNTDGTHCNYSSALDNGTEGYRSAQSAPPDSAETVETADDGFVELGASGGSAAGPSGGNQQ